MGSDQLVSSLEEIEEHRTAGEGGTARAFASSGDANGFDRAGAMTDGNSSGRANHSRGVALVGSAGGRWDTRSGKGKSEKW